MLDRAFLELVGAGAATLAPAFGFDVPPGAVTGGAAFVARLCRENPADAKALVEAATREIWASAKPAGLRPDQIVAQIERLPAILEFDQDRPEHPATIAKLVATHARSATASIDRAARDLTTAHLVIFRSTGALSLNGLDEEIVSVLLDALFRGLLKTWHVLDAHRDLLRTYLESLQRHQPALSDQSGAMSDVDEAVRDALIERFGRTGHLTDLVDRCTTLCHTLLADLDRLAAQSTGRTGKIIAKARKFTSAGDPIAANTALAAIEDINIRAALSDISDLRGHLAAAANVRVLRGHLHEAFGDFLRAANHYALAIRHLPRSDHATRWQLAEHQARALGLAAQFSDNPTASTQAGQVREAAVEILPEWWSELQRGNHQRSPDAHATPLQPAQPLSHLLALIEGPGRLSPRAAPHE